jgi:hypothetical protein
VYLITNKFSRLLKEQQTDENDEDAKNNVIRGYYLYLTFRPFVGLVIGPILYLFVMAGLITFIKHPITSPAEVSQPGRYFIYVLSFLGGHASSDLLDYFSRVIKKISVKVFHD